MDRTVRTAGRDFSREAGKPWMSAVKRPYDRQVKKAENLYKRGSEAQQRQDVETRREIPDLYGPEDLDYTDVNRSGGSVTSETAGDMPVTTVTAPNGGSIRQEIEPNKEGDTAKARFFVLVQQGSARVTVRDNEGRVLKQGPWESSRDSDPSRPLEVVVDLPSDGKGYGGTDAAHNYIANLELSPGAKVQVYQAEVCHTAENDG